MNEEKHLVFDGGFATELVSNGYDIDEDPLWSARLLSTNQDAIVKVHENFLMSGADAILSATYQASIDGFLKHLKCNSSDAQKLIRDGARIVKKVCDEFWDEVKDKDPIRIRPLSCASLGPYGAHLGDASEYTGNYVHSVSQSELFDFHEQRLSIMAKEELDLYVFETIPALAEAETLLQLIRQYPNQKFLISFSCKDGKHLCHGETLEDAVKMINSSNQVVAVGINCTSPYYITSLLRSIEGLTDKKVLIMPNSGEVWEGKRWVNSNTVQEIQYYVEEWIKSGADWIGGCCRTTPNDISNIKKLVSQL